MYILDDVPKPNVFRNMFPYSEIPKIPFNDRRSLSYCLIVYNVAAEDSADLIGRTIDGE